jgi:hypothetical protein
MLFNMNIMSISVHLDIAPCRTKTNKALSEVKIQVPRISINQDQMNETPICNPLKREKG